MESEERNEGSLVGIACDSGRQLYEGYVMERMEGRAGAYTPKGAPGIALEVMATDKSNLTNKFNADTISKLTKSSTANQLDAVTVQAGKVVERVQYKDTVSKSGIAKTLKQVESGKYQQAQLRGTVEAAEKYNVAAKSAGVTKNMQSTGISHNTTQRVGDKFTGQPIKASSLGDAVKGSASTAAGITAAIEIGKSFVNGDTVGECAGHVVSKGAESAINATVATGAGELVATTAAVMIPGVLPIAAGVFTTIGVGIVAGELTNGLFDDIGDDIGNNINEIAYDVKNTVDNFLDDVGCFFSGLFF